MKILRMLLLAVPVSIVLEYMHVSPLLLFVVSALAVIPLAGIMGEATEEIAHYAGPQIGGLLNATFGNAAELIIAIIAIKEGLYDVVKASIAGSIIGNILLVLGISVLVGGVKYKVQTFNRTIAGVNSTMLFLAVIGLVIPAVFMEHIVKAKPHIVNELSLGVAAILMICYILGLLFSLHTHKHLAAYEQEEFDPPKWSLSKALLILLGATVLVAIESEILVGAIEPVVETLGWSELFIGIIIIPIIGNAAEHSSAVLMALKNKMDVSLEIAVGSSTQIALFVAPLIVFVSLLFGEQMNFIFNIYEISAIAVAVFIANYMSHDGEAYWIEGAQLLAAYLIIAIAFFFAPAI